MKTKKKRDWFYVFNQAYRIIGIAVLLATICVILFNYELLEKQSFRYIISGWIAFWSISSILLGMQNLKQQQSTSKLIDQLTKK